MELVWYFQPSMARRLIAAKEIIPFVTSHGLHQPYVQRHKIAEEHESKSVEELMQLYPCTTQAEENIVEKVKAKED